MPTTASSTSVAVIGAGPGGYAAAFLAADLGLQVVLIDREPDPGGVCLYRGCIPSKALLHAARLLREARAASHMGIDFGPPKIDLARLRAWKDEVVHKLTSGLGELGRRRKLRYLQGTARFLDAHRLRVTTSAAEHDEEIRFEHAIVATGSRPIRLPGFATDSPRILDSTSALALTERPDRLLVVGGGYIGLELGSVYAALGSRVSVVELTASLLPGVDADLVRPLARRLKGELEELRLETRVVEAHDTGGEVRVKLEGPEIEGERSYDQVLVAVGREPVTAELGLEGTRVVRDHRGTIEVDAQRRTAEPSIFAIGDVTGGPMLAHKASHEGRVAAEVIAGREVSFAPRGIPAVVFTDPEIAWCGLTETEAKAAGRQVTVARFPWSASGRAATLGAPEGLTKLIVDPESERLLGVGICGSGAGELIAEGVLALEMGALASDVALSIHAHPTLSETMMEAAEAFAGHPTHIFR